MLKKSMLTLAFAFVFLTLCESAFATHFRFTHTTWRRISNNVDGSVTVEFNSVQAWRTSFLDILPLDLGDGNFYFPATINDLLTTTDLAGEEYTIRQYSYQHTYSAQAIADRSGRFLVVQESCCRISTLVNAADASERIETLVDLNGNNAGSPVSVSPVIIQFAFAKNNTLQIASADPDGDAINCRMSDSFESQIPTLATYNSNDLTVSPGCLLSWDLTSATVADVGSKYAAQVSIEESNRCVDGQCGKVILDFIIEIVDGNPPVVTANVPVNNTAYANVPFSATFSCTDADAGDVVTLSALGAPAGAVFTPASGSSSTAPYAFTMTWTPTDADKNSVYAVLVTCRDQTNLEGTTSISITVSPDAPDPQCTEFDISGSQFLLDGSAKSQFNLLKATVAKFRRAGGSKSEARAIVAQGKALYTQGWTATWTIPSKQFSCVFNTLCASVSNTSELTNYVNAVEGLKNLISSTAKKYKKLSKGNIKSILAESNGYVNLQQAEIANIPATSDNCSTLSVNNA